MAAGRDWGGREPAAELALWGPPLPAPGLGAPDGGLGCRGPGEGVVDRRGHSPARGRGGREEAGCGALGWAGRSLGGGFPELLLLLGLESRDGLGLCPSDPLASAPPSLAASPA